MNNINDLMILCCTVVLTNAIVCSISVYIVVRLPGVTGFRIYDSSTHRTWPPVPSKVEYLRSIAPRGP